MVMAGQEEDTEERPGDGPDPEPTLDDPDSEPELQAAWTFGGEELVRSDSGE